MQTKKSPSADTEGTPKDSIGWESEARLSADASALVDHVHVVVTRIEAENTTRYRRHVYWSLANAQRAIDRASMAGRAADMVLCQLVPVSGGAHE